MTHAPAAATALATLTRAPGFFADGISWASAITVSAAEIPSSRTSVIGPRNSRKTSHHHAPSVRPRPACRSEPSASPSSTTTSTMNRYRYASPSTDTSPGSVTGTSAPIGYTHEMSRTGHTPSRTPPAAHCRYSSGSPNKAWAWWLASQNSTAWTTTNAAHTPTRPVAPRSTSSALSEVDGTARRSASAGPGRESAELVDAGSLMVDHPSGGG